MTDLAKMEYANFVKVIMLTKGKDNENTFGKLRINPMSISSYFEAFDTRGEKIVPITAMCVGGSTYYLDMKIEEVDEMMDSIDRGFSIKE